MGQRPELQCWHHASKKPIGMNVRQRLSHVAAAGALPTRRCGPPDISPISLRFNGMRCTCARFSRCEPPRSGAAYPRVSVGRVLQSPPNKWLERTAQQRRCACCWVPSALRAPAAAQPQRLGLFKVAAMTDLFPPWPLFSAFLLASFVLAVTPGPGVLYIVTRSLVQGRRFGLVSVAGVALGNLGNALAASVGLAALFAVSSLAFSVVKYAGALYLVYLGVQMLRSSRAENSAAVPAAAPLKRVFRDGFVVALLNPKTTVFFAAFLPQFLSPNAPPMFQTMALGSLFVAIAAVTDSAYALAAGAAAPALRGSVVRRIGRRLGAGVFIGLGVFTALAGSRGAK